MSTPKPAFTKKKVNKAGEILAGSECSSIEKQQALDVLNNWRACHSYPINTFQSTLRKWLKDINGKAIVAQRLKRAPSIIAKLIRFKTMQLSRMQDIGGLRSVLDTLEEVRKLETRYLSSGLIHELVSKKDYIENPKKSGYRSIHLVYRYINTLEPSYDGLLVELQIRTKLQHIWATAVETVGTFLQHSLKSSEGPKEWLVFFALVGSAFAFIESTPQVPGFEELTKNETIDKIEKEALKLNLFEKLSAFTIAAGHISFNKKKSRTHYYHLVVLNIKEKKVSIKSYSKKSLNVASNAYKNIEKEIIKGAPLQAVLVSTGTIGTLRNAYPSYFLDTKEFISKLRELIQSIK